MKNAIIIAIIHKDYKKVLLTKRAREPFKGYWSLAGGFGALGKEPNPEKAIKIEIKDDMDVEFSGKLFTTIGKQKEKRLYFCGTIKGRPKIKSKETVSEIRWFNIDDAIKMPPGFEDKKILEKFRKDFSKYNL